MKATGVVRKMDELGRIVIPMEMRRTWGIKPRDPIEMFVDEDSIVLRKYEKESACVITGKVSSDCIKLPNGNIISTEGLLILKNEIEKLKSIL